MTVTCKEECDGNVRKYIIIPPNTSFPRMTIVVGNDSPGECPPLVVLQHNQDEFAVRIAQVAEDDMPSEIDGFSREGTQEFQTFDLSDRNAYFTIPTYPQAYTPDGEERYGFVFQLNDSNSSTYHASYVLELLLSKLREGGLLATSDLNRINSFEERAAGNFVDPNYGRRT
jgi:hypothetical protein